MRHLKKMPPSTLPSVKKQKQIALLVIGDEILSGKTKDDNIHHVAKKLFTHGASLAMVRVVADDKAMIIKNLRELLAQNDFVMTTGGIGPTHDDITTAAVGRALKLPLVIDATADKLLRAHYVKMNLPYNDERRKMAMVPRGAKLLLNPISVAPGFFVKKTFVMAGVPRIMHEMLEQALLFIAEGPKWWQAEIETSLWEGTFAKGLTAIQKKYKNVVIGSYPKFNQEAQKLWVLITLKSLDKEHGGACQQEVAKLLHHLETKSS